jgi:hypothetical protein
MKRLHVDAAMNQTDFVGLDTGPIKESRIALEIATTPSTRRL